MGWSGAVQTALHPQGPVQWLTAGLTVIPGFRRVGIGRRLLETVFEGVQELGGEGPLHSVVNARNRPSLDLHRSVGFDVIESGPRFAGIEFDGGVGLLLGRR